MTYFKNHHILNEEGLLLSPEDRSKCEVSVDHEQLKLANNHLVSEGNVRIQSASSCALEKDLIQSDEQIDQILDVTKD